MVVVLVAPSCKQLSDLNWTHLGHGTRAHGTETVGVFKRPEVCAEGAGKGQCKFRMRGSAFAGLPMRCAHAQIASSSFYTDFA
jgi:hypothetical protein